jgi:hypothetical protein
MTPFPVRGGLLWKSGRPDLLQTPPTEGPGKDKVRDGGVEVDPE